MKQLLLIAAIALISLSVTPVANANTAQSLCEYVAVDDKKRLRTYLKSNKLKIRKVFDGVQCNGQNLLAFASSKNATKTGSLMISKLPKKTVTAVLPSITQQDLVDAANKRISS